MGSCIAANSKSVKPHGYNPEDNFKCIVRSYSYTRLSEATQQVIERGLEKTKQALEVETEMSDETADSDIRKESDES